MNVTRTLTHKKEGAATKMKTFKLLCG